MLKRTKLFTGWIGPIIDLLSPAFCFLENCGRRIYRAEISYKVVLVGDEIGAARLLAKDVGQILMMMAGILEMGLFFFFFFGLTHVYY